MRKMVICNCDFYLDIGSKFLRPNSTLSKTVMPDLLHPNALGYEIWAKSMEPAVRNLWARTQKDDPG